MRRFLCIVFGNVAGVARFGALKFFFNHGGRFRSSGYLVLVRLRLGFL
jgi:hypothetical protein